MRFSVHSRALNCRADNVNRLLFTQKANRDREFLTAEGLLTKGSLYKIARRNIQGK